MFSRRLYEKFGGPLREHAKNMTDFFKKKSYPIYKTKPKKKKKKLKWHQDATECYICRKKLINNLSKDKNHQKVRKPSPLYW